MLTISQLARKHGLSRSTLLYYDSIGLLSPSDRSAKGYRRYSEEDAARLARICMYRQAGMPLADIQRVLDGAASELENALARRLDVLNDEIAELQGQQRFILGILRKGAHRDVAGLDKAKWTSLLAACGFSEADMMHWHAVFERLAPEDHQRFLEFLNVSRDEIDAIRAFGRQGGQER